MPANRRQGCRRSSIPALLKQFGTRPTLARDNQQNLPEDLGMSSKKLALIVALIVSAGAIASGIVYAQEASTPQTETLRALLNAEAESSQDPGARNFTFF